MTKKSKAEQVEEKVQDAAPAAEQAEQMEGADAARQPSEEELKAMLRGENRQHDEALGDAWAVLLGQNPMAVMPQVVGTVLHDGGPRPAWQWKRSGKDYVLMAWPKDQPSRAAVLMQADEGEKFKPLSAVPFLEGLPNDLTVEDIHPWSQGGGANVAVSMIEGKNPMWFYDPLYLRDKDDLTPGVTQTFWLSDVIDPSIPTEMLPADVQQAIIEAGRETTVEMRALLDKQESASREFLKEKGMVFCGVPTDEDEWMKRAVSIWPQFYPQIKNLEIVEAFMKTLGRQLPR